MGSPTLYERFAARRIATALADTPAVMVNGPRQCGKTTLVRDFARRGSTYLTLDDDTVLQAARADPVGLLRHLDRVIIDEVQHAPELLRAIKRLVDDDRRPGRFLLTGSANVLALPQASESLAGRMEVVTLLPLSQAELRGRAPQFLIRAFMGEVAPSSRIQVGADLVRLVVRGGYPEMLKRTDARRQKAWARDYINAILQRDVRDIATVEHLEQLPRLLRAMAHHSAQLVNFTQLGGTLGLDDKTTRKYVGVFEQLFLVRRLEPWFNNQLSRLVKTPKLYFLDSGLLAVMLGTSVERIAKDRSRLGPLLETFVLSELMKQMTWMDDPCTLYHYRDKDQDEVDFVIENEHGDLVGVEVKAAATVHAGDFKGLRKLAGARSQDFKLGVVVYDGDALVPFGERLFAAPLSCVWGS